MQGTSQNVPESTPQAESQRDTRGASQGALQGTLQGAPELAPQGVLRGALELEQQGALQGAPERTLQDEECCALQGELRCATRYAARKRQGARRPDPSGETGRQGACWHWQKRAIACDRRALRCGLPSGIAMLVAALLSAACAIPVCHAQYTSSGEGAAHARVAEFCTEATSTLDETLSFNLAPGDCEPIDVVVRNDGEVAARHEITVSVCGTLPLAVQAAASSPLSAEEPAVDADAGTCTWTCETAPHEGERVVGFELLWPAECDDPSYANGSGTVQIHVESTQVD